MMKNKFKWWLLALLLVGLETVYSQGAPESQSLTVTNRILGQEGSLDIVLNEAQAIAEEGIDVTVYFNVSPDANGQTLCLLSSQINPVQCSAGTITLTKDPSNSFEQGIEYWSGVSFTQIFYASNKVFMRNISIRKISDDLIATCATLGNAGAFYNSTAKPCPNVLFQYSIPAVTGVDGYEWIYTGDGASIKLVSDNEAAPTQTLNHTISYTNLNGNDVYIKFTENFTSGALTVRPYKFCPIINGKYYGASTTINLSPISGLSYTVSPNSAFNCQQSSMMISASLTNSDVEPSIEPNYYWYSPNNTTPLATEFDLQTSISDQSGSANSYISVVTFELGGKSECVVTDTVIIVKDTLRPFISLPGNSFTLNCTNPTQLLNAVGPANTQFTWSYGSQTYSNPLTIDTINFAEGNYTVDAYNTSNFCSNSTTVSVNFDFTLPNAPLVNNLSVEDINPYKVIGCETPTLTMTATNQSGDNNLLTWASTNNNVVVFNEAFYQDVLTVTGSNGCTRNYTVYSIVDFTVPTIQEKPDVYVSCSYPTTTLDHVAATTGTSGWIDPLDGTRTELEVLGPVGAGTYQYAYVHPISGCISYDEVLVINNQQLDVTLPTEIDVCKNKSFSLTPAVVYEMQELLKYEWYNGHGDITYTGTGISDHDERVNVYIYDDLGNVVCYGSASTFVDIIMPMTLTYTVHPICNGSVTGIEAIVSNVEAPKVQFMLSGSSTPQISPFFQVEELNGNGGFVLYAIDAVGCVRAIEGMVVGPIIEEPHPSFLAPTYNHTNDIVALVNTTEYEFDQLEWVLPPGLIFVSETDEIKYIKANQPGYYTIKVVGHEEACSFWYEKQIYFGESLPVNFEVDPEKGIVNFTVSPNPTTGAFTANVEFGVAQNYYIYVTDVLGNVLFDAPAGYGISTSFSGSLNSLASGNYMIHVVSEFDSDYAVLLKTQ